MNVDYLDKAKERISTVPLLINVVSRRVRQLNGGNRPLIKPDSPHMPNLDVALKEIAEGKLTAEMVFSTEEDVPLTSTDRLISL
ncbi:MAG: DNA-directed RNA polymerase subunit omega [Kiritimatiellae bacterium]|nr:DNA-directed RNA polymerase subunit omega [Kiritimatiellia bacterium]